MPAVASDSAGKSSIWIRNISSVVARPLSGTEEASFPFWSYESRSLGFFVGGKLKRIDISGGPGQTICEASDGRGGSWGSAGVILFAPSFGTGLQQVSAAGGVPANITALDTTLKEDSHRWPWFLPDGKHFLYLRRGATEKSGVYLGSLDSKEFSLVVPSKANAIYTADGYLLFLREATLIAQPFDPATGRFRGEPLPIADEIGADFAYSYGFFSASNNGVLLVGAGTGLSFRQLVWFDRTGRRLNAAGNPGTLFDFALASDENRVVFRRVDLQTGNHDLWILDLVRSTESRFTFAPTLDDDPVWSPDGSSIVFDSNPEGTSNIHRKVASGAGKEELLVKSPNGNFPLDYSADGRYILYIVVDPQTQKSKLWILPLTGDRKPFPYIEGQMDAFTAKFSPDVKWVAYSSDESGRTEVYVQTFPATDAKWQVSTTGGSTPQWSKDGTELYYISPNKKMMVVDVKTQGGTFTEGIPKQLFDADVDRYTAPNRYAVTNDKQRFLVNVPAEVSKVMPLTVVLNWPEELRKK